MNTTLPFSAACERNKAPIFGVLNEFLPQPASILEIGSGTGQHAVHFAAQRNDWQWQPSEQRVNLPGLCLRLEAEGSENIAPPFELDVTAREHWPGDPYNAVFTANTAHIMPWSAVLDSLALVRHCLRPGGLLLIYGPFTVAGRHTAESNQAFDLNLRATAAHQGIRDLDELQKQAAMQHLQFKQRRDMPANNMLLVFERLENNGAE